jgi:hypothetical protein
MFANQIEPGDAPDGTLRGPRRIRSWNPTRQERDSRRFHGSWCTATSGTTTSSSSAIAWFSSRISSSWGERARIDDLALTLYFACLAHAIDARCLRRLVGAYERGLGEPLTTAERAALPLAMARQPLWSIGGWVARLDEERTARRHAATMHGAVAWARDLVRDLDRWQATFV